MSKGFRVAVVGATGLVGETMISVLEERKFPVSELYALASNRSLGKHVSFNGKQLPVDDLASFDFSRADIGLFSAGGGDLSIGVRRR
jgi:aspartate-semialdehyde dehydrogenase